MNCENILCVYQKNGECTLDCISLDIMGSCQECFLVSLDKAYVEKEKDRMIKEPDKRYTELEEKIETDTKKKQKVDDQLLPKSVSSGKIKL